MGGFLNLHPVYIYIYTVINPGLSTTFIVLKIEKNSKQSLCETWINVQITDITTTGSSVAHRISKQDTLIYKNKSQSDKIGVYIYHKSVQIQMENDKCIHVQYNSWYISNNLRPEPCKAFKQFYIYMHVYRPI